MDRTDKAIVAGLVLTAATAGVLSYAALAAFADIAQLDEPWWWTKWLWPLALDMPTVLLSMAAWRKRSVGDPAWGTRVCIGALAAVSTLLQVSTAPAGNLAALVGHALPPVLLLVSWESVLALQSAGRRGQGEVGGQVATVGVDVPAVAMSVAGPPTVVAQHANGEHGIRLLAGPVASPVEPAASSATELAAGPASVPVAVAELRAEGVEPTTKAVAERLAVSPRTVTRWRRDPSIAVLFNEKSVPILLDRAGTLARPAASGEDTERAPSPLSAPDLVDSAVSAGGSR